MKGTNSIVFKLFRLNEIETLKLLQRPSTKIKSPYVSDGVKNNLQYTIHTPALDMGGQCVPGTNLICIKSNQTSKTDYTLYAIELKETDYEKVYIGSNPFFAEKILRLCIEEKLVDHFKEFKITKKPPEIDYRGDLYGTLNEKPHIIEVKNVICATYDPKKPIDKNSHKFYETSKPFIRSGIYPFGKSKQKWKKNNVVSARSVRQLDTMTKIIKKNKDVEFSIVFIVNRSDCNLFRPNWVSDPIYCKYLIKAKNAGVKLIALKIHWDRTSCYFESEIDIELKKW